MCITKWLSISTSILIISMLFYVLRSWREIVLTNERIFHFDYKRAQDHKKFCSREAMKLHRQSICVFLSRDSRVEVDQYHDYLLQRQHRSSYEVYLASKLSCDRLKAWRRREWFYRDSSSRERCNSHEACSLERINFQLSQMRKW